VRSPSCVRAVLLTRTGARTHTHVSTCTREAVPIAGNTLTRGSRLFEIINANKDETNHAGQTNGFGRITP
jgi:hypothetical protein